MREKAKKIVIEDNNYLFFVYLFCIASAYTLTLVIKNMTLFHVFIFLIFFILTAIAIYSYKKYANKDLKKFILTDNKIFFYNYKNSISEKISINLNEIRTFHVSIYCKVNQKEYSRNNFFEKIFIKITTNTDNFEFYNNQPKRNFIRNIFKIANRIPNFSYSVITNSNIIKKHIDSLATKQTSLSLKEFITAYNNDPSIPVHRKRFFNALLILAIIFALIAIPIIIICLIQLIKLFLLIFS